MSTGVCGLMSVGCRLKIAQDGLLVELCRCEIVFCGFYCTESCCREKARRPGQLKSTSTVRTRLRANPLIDPAIITCR